MMCKNILKIKIAEIFKMAATDWIFVDPKVKTAETLWIFTILIKMVMFLQMYYQFLNFCTKYRHLERRR
jgi:hypothetical protein